MYGIPTILRYISGILLKKVLIEEKFQKRLEM